MIICTIFSWRVAFTGTAVDRFRQVKQRVRVLRGRRLRGRRASVHILRSAHQRRLLGAQRIRLPGQRTRRREDTAGRLSV